MLASFWHLQLTHWPSPLAELSTRISGLARWRTASTSAVDRGRFLRNAGCIAATGSPVMMEPALQTFHRRADHCYRGKTKGCGK